MPLTGDRSMDPSTSQCSVAMEGVHRAFAQKDHEIIIGEGSDGDVDSTTFRLPSLSLEPPWAIQPSPLARSSSLNSRRLTPTPTPEGMLSTLLPFGAIGVKDGQHFRSRGQSYIQH